MAKDKLIGNLNMNMIDVDYQGVETETASTTVDNNKRTIATEVKKVRFPLVFAINGEKVIYDGSESILISYDHFDSDLEAEIAQRKVAVGNEEARARAREHELESDAASFLDIVQDEQTGIVTIKLLNIRNEVLDTKTLDLETEKIIRTITLNYPAKKLIFTSVDGTAIECDIKDMINDFEAKLANLDTSLTNVLATESSRAVSEEGRIEAKAEDLVATEKNRAEDAESQLAADLTGHKADKANPHGVTKAQVGLGNADNTSDIDKPVSTAQQAALDLKLDKDNFGWAIADHTYNPEFGYTAGDTVYYVDVDNPHRGYLYVAKEDIAAPAGDFDYTKWNTTTLERLIWYKQDKINDNNKLFADYVDDSNAVHKFATSEQLTQIATNATDISNHKADNANPHNVTKTQVGLGEVVNTGDSATPVENGTTKFTTGGAYALKTNLEASISDEATARSQADTNLQNQIDLDIEVVPYQTTTPLTDKQVAKAQAGKLAIYDPNSTATLTCSGYSGGNLLFTAFKTWTYIESAAENYVNTLDAKIIYCYLDSSTKKLGSLSTSDIKAPSGNSKNVFSATIVPNSTGQELVRALNLRKTQDMIADVYDSTATYAYGDYCIYQNDFYKCTTAITTAEAWTAAHWTKMTLAEAGNELTTEEINYNDYTAANSLSDLQILKAKCGKLIISTNSRSYSYIPIFYGSDEITFGISEELSWGAQSGNNINKAVDGKKGYIRLSFINKNLRLSSSSFKMITDNSDNFISDSVIPAADGKQLVRAQNLRKTQDMLADVYDATKTYAVGDYVIYQNNLYRCKTAISTAEAFDSTKWDQVKAAEVNNEEEIECASGETGTILTNAQIEKAKNGKLVLLRNNVYLFYHHSDSVSGRIYFIGHKNRGTTTTTGGSIYKTAEIKTTGVYINLANNTVNLSENTEANSISTNADNFFDESIVPDVNNSNEKRKVVRALNLRKTQDMISPDYYDATATYNVGDVIIYQNDLYECNTAISTAEAWTAAHWTKTSASALIEKYKFHVVNLSSRSGTLTSAQLEVLKGDYGIIIYDSRYYFKFVDMSNFLNYQPVGNETGTYQVTYHEVVINKTTGAYNISDYSIKKPNANETLAGTEDELKELSVSTTKYKVLNSEQFYPAYNSTYTYSIGDIVSYKGKFYICISAISTAEAWTAAHWAETNPGQQVIELTAVSGTLTDVEYAKVASKNALILYNNFYYLKYKETNDNCRFSGVCFEWD